MTNIEYKLAEAIQDEIEGNEGTFCIDIEVSDTMTIEVSGSYEIDGYCEDDYFNGTGAWITTYASVVIENVEAYDEAGEAIEVDCDTCEIERSVERGLAA